MSQPFVGEIRMFGGSFAPAGWAMCDGQLLPISQNETLFNLIGTTYGGDGQATFALPQIAGRIPVGAGTNPSTGTSYQNGELAGTESVTLTTNQIPSHNHAFVCTTTGGISTNITNNAYGSSGQVAMYTETTDPLNKPLNSNEGPLPVGGSQPHENLMPYLAVTFIISLFGIFPHQ